MPNQNSILRGLPFVVTFIFAGIALGFLAATVLDAGILGFLIGVLTGIAASVLYLFIAARHQR